jgi:hypothetical protein
MQMWMVRKLKLISALQSTVIHRQHSQRKTHIDGCKYGVKGDRRASTVSKAKDGRIVPDT